jgi:predicted dienelactone hydrolase
VALHVQHDDHADSPLEYNRPLDIRLVVNRIAINRLMIPNFKGTLDAGRIGHAGHSAGAYTAMAVAGAKVKMPPGYEGTEARFAEPRIKAFVAISPQGVGSIGVADSPARASFEPGAWSGITRPMYEIVGAQELGSDAFSQNRPPAWRLDPWRAMPAGDKHLAILPGADHMNFRQGGLEPGNAVETRTLDFTHANMAAFFDVYLKNERSKSSTIGTLRRPAGTVTEAK